MHFASRLRVCALALPLLWSSACASEDDGDGAGAVDDRNTYCAQVADWDPEWEAFEADVLALVNDVRSTGTTCGGEAMPEVGPLTMQGQLRCAARVHSLDMAENEFFDHTNLEGQSPWDRMELAGYAMSAGGENIAAGYPTPQAVVDGWLNSPGHCRNIMGANFTEIGVGYAAPEGAGSFGSYWTQVFGSPAAP